ncbi:MAG: TM2 domain-containing protein [Armatimonadetes bacterium]|nr:TM2 domain-containing protein [Armatimonadota bacterium]
MYSVIGPDGMIYGPVDAQTLQQWVNEGRVLPTTTIIDANSGQHVQAQSHPIASTMFAPPSNAGYPPGTQTHVSSPYGSGTAAGTGFNQPGGSAPSNYPRQHPHYSGAPMVGSRTKVIAALLAFFLGGLGIHKFYLGFNQHGIIMLVLGLLGFVTCGVTSLVASVWAIYDFIMILVSDYKDADGYSLG